jgi:hypothetical protein
MNKDQTTRTNKWIISRRAIEADHERVFPSELSGKSWFGSLSLMFERTPRAR